MWSDFSLGLVRNILLYFFKQGRGSRTRCQKQGLCSPAAPRAHTAGCLPGSETRDETRAAVSVQLFTGHTGFSGSGTSVKLHVLVRVHRPGTQWGPLPSQVALPAASAFPS